MALEKKTSQVGLELTLEQIVSQVLSKDAFIRITHSFNGLEEAAPIGRQYVARLLTLKGDVILVLICPLSFPSGNPFRSVLLIRVKEAVANSEVLA